MIVKVRTADAGWEYFSCPKGVKVRQLTKEQTEYVWANKDENYIIHAHAAPGNRVVKDPSLKLTLINIYDNTKIYTDSMVYLLNDEGKTIDKLN